MGERPSQGLNNLTRGNYSLAVDKPGFRRLVRRPVTVRVQGSIRIDASLEVGEASQTMEVIAEARLELNEDWLRQHMAKGETWWG